MIEWKRLYMKASGIAPRWRRHAMGCGSHHGFRSSVPDLLDLARRRGAGRASRSNRDGHNRAPQLYRSDDSAGGRRNDAGRNQAGSGGSSLAGAATTASQRRRTYCRQPSGPTCRAESRHRATLHPGRMATPGALAPGSRLSGAAVRFAVRRSHRPTANWTAAQAAASASLTILQPQKMKARKPCNKRLTQCGRSRPALKMKSRRRPKRIKRLSRHSAERRPRPKLPRLFPPPRPRAAPRREITLFRRGSRRHKTLPAGSVSMKARF